MEINLIEMQNIKGIHPDKPIFPISIVAELLKVHQRTLRIYDEESILIPSRSPKNRRLYSVNDVEKGKFIQYLTRELRLNLAGMRIIFSLLKQQNITQDKYMEYIRNMAQELNICPEDQEIKKIKLSKRSRKPESNQNL